MRQMAEENYGVPFLQALTERLAAIYEEAHEELLVRFDAPELHDLLPHFRRARFEQEMRGIARQHGLTGISQLNRRRTSFHTRVTANDMVLTASAVATPRTIVRHAEFRETLARDSQMTLWNDPGPEGSAYYSLYIHGPLVTPQGHSLPKLGFAHLVFPNRFLTSYIGRIDLLESYAPNRAPVNIPVEEIQKATITLLQQLREEQA